MTNDLTLTLIGGPTVLIETGDLRLLTDPTFDAAGGEYPNPPFVLEKLRSPAVALDALPPIDAVLLSHEQHADNLDKSGRALLNNVKTVLTTPDSAAQLADSNAIGLNVWETFEIEAADKRRLRITATPARHGPAGSEAMTGAVTGFVLEWTDEASDAVYVSGDTVWYEGIAEIANRFRVGTAMLFLGAAGFAAAPELRFTMNAAEAVQAAAAFANAIIVPAHCEGWAHFQESRREVEGAFAAAKLGDRLTWLEPGVAVKFG